MIHRALQDAPLAAASAVPFRCRSVKGGYVIEAFLPTAVLNGFDPEEHPRLGVYYAVRDSERGEQTLAVGSRIPLRGRPQFVAGSGPQSLTYLTATPPSPRIDSPTRQTCVAKTRQLAHE